MVIVDVLRNMCTIEGKLASDGSYMVRRTRGGRQWHNGCEIGPCYSWNPCP